MAARRASGADVPKKSNTSNSAPAEPPGKCPGPSLEARRASVADLYANSIAFTIFQAEPPGNRAPRSSPSLQLEEYHPPIGATWKQLPTYSEVSTAFGSLNPVDPSVCGLLPPPARAASLSAGDLLEVELANSVFMHVPTSPRGEGGDVWRCQWLGEWLGGCSKKGKQDKREKR